MVYGDRFPTDFMLCSTCYKEESNRLRNAIQLDLHMFYVKSLTAYLVYIRSMLIVVTFGVCVSWLTWFGRRIRRGQLKTCSCTCLDMSFQSACRETLQNLFVWLIFCHTWAKAALNHSDTLELAKVCDHASFHCQTAAHLMDGITMCCLLTSLQATQHVEWVCHMSVTVTKCMQLTFFFDREEHCTKPVITGY